jgi:hypothetical protein
VNQAAPVELGENREDSPGAVHIFHMHRGRRRGDLADVRHLAGEPVDVAHGEGHFAFLRGGQQVQHRIRRAAHRDVERHGVFKSGQAGDAAGKRGSVILFVITLCQFDDAAAGLEKQVPAIRVSRHDGAVAGQR